MKDKVIAALVCFAYLVCICGPAVMLMHLHRAAFVVLVLGLAAFGWPTVKPFAKKLTD